MDTRKIAILGGGRIGEALLSGLLSSGWREPGEVVVTSRREERNAELHERYGTEATTDNAAAVSGAAVVVVAVKPQDIDALLDEVGEHLTRKQTLVSVAAAITTAHIEARIADGVPARTRATSSLRSPTSSSRTSAASCACRSRGWTRSPPSRVRARPTSHCWPRR
jgi:pyrroline-5-carboxylate reductase